MILDIWRSFRRLPLWVQLWVAGILVPVNMATLLFWSEPLGLWVAALAVGGMLPNMVILAVERGFSKAMAFPHILIWTPLLIVVIALLDDPALISEGNWRFLWVLLGVNIISLGFDFTDGWKWWKGDREVA